MVKKKKTKCPFDLDNRAKKVSKKGKQLARPSTHVLQKEVDKEMKELKRGLV